MCKAKRNRLQDSLHNDALGDVQADDRGGCNDVGQAEGVATGCPTELQGNECIRAQTCQDLPAHTVASPRRKSVIRNINAHQRTSMDMNGHQRTSMDMNGHQRTSMDINGHQLTSTDINGHERTSTDIDGHQRTSTDINEHQRTSTEINGHQWTSTDIN